MVLIPRVPQPWPRILGQRSALSRGMPGNSEQGSRTKPVRDGVFRGRGRQRPAVLWSQVCGGGGLDLVCRTHSQPRFSVRQPANLQTVARSVTDRTPLPTESCVARSREGSRPPGRVRFGEVYIVRPALVCLQRFAKLRAALVAGRDPPLQVALTGNNAARHRRAAPDPPHGRAHSLPPKVRRGSQRLVSEHAHNPKANLDNGVQVLQNKVDSSSSCSTDKSEQSQCFCRVAIKDLSALLRDVFWRRHFRPHFGHPAEYPCAGIRSRQSWRARRQWQQRIVDQLGNVFRKVFRKIALTDRRQHWRSFLQHLAIFLRNLSQGLLCQLFTVCRNLRMVGAKAPHPILHGLQ
jgi:hypothetical protein